MKHRFSIALILIFFLGIFLRFFHLPTNPPSLYWDEVTIGLDAYSLATRGQDINNHSWLQPMFGSYGDFKAPVYIWLLTPFVKIFGLHNWVVRLPAAILGTIIIGLAFCLTKIITPIKFSKWLPLSVAALVAISPWPVQFSRIGFEAGISVAFLLLSLIFFYRKNLILCSLSAVIGVYAYYPLRLIFPLLYLPLGLINLKSLLSDKKRAFAAIIIFLLGIVPFYLSPYYQRSQEYRASDSLLTNPAIVQQSSRFLETYGSSRLVKLTYHRYAFYLKDFLTNYFSHYSLNFIFINGDQNTLRQHSGFGGEFFLMLIFPFIFGLVWLIKHPKEQISILTWVLYLISPLPAAFKYQVPNNSRAIYLYLPIIFTIGLGILFLSKFKKTFLIFSIFLAFNIFTYYYDYFLDYPKRSSQEWMYQNQQAAEFIRDYYQDYSIIDVADLPGMPAASVVFYNPFLIDRLAGLKQAMLNSPITSYGFPDWKEALHQNRFYPDQITPLPQAKILTPNQPIPTGYKLLKEEFFLDNTPSLIIVVKP